VNNWLPEKLVQAVKLVIKKQVITKGFIKRKCDLIKQLNLIVILCVESRGNSRFLLLKFVRFLLQKSHAMHGFYKIDGAIS
jgi:hypothetical protein